MSLFLTEYAGSKTLFSAITFICFSFIYYASVDLAQKQRKAFKSSFEWCGFEFFEDGCVSV